MKKRLFIASILFVSLLTIVFLVRISFSRGAPVEKANWYTDYTYTLDNTKNTITVTKYNGTDTEIILPNTATISGKTYQTIVQGGVYQSNTNLKTIIFKNGVKSGTTLANLFRGCENLETLTLNNFDTSDAESMYTMFMDCKKLTSLDVSMLNTTKVKNMQSMFIRVPVTTLDLSNFNTPALENMQSMFYEMKNIESLDLSSFDTSNVTNMKQVFYGCAKLKSVNVTSFDTTSVTSMSNMFETTSLRELDLSSFDTTNVVDFRSFCGTNLTRIKLGPKTNFKSNTSSGYTFGRGTWTKLEDGKTYNVVEIHDMATKGTAAGTYVKVSNISDAISMDFPVTYQILPTTKIDSVSCTNSNFEFRNNREIYLNNVPITNTVQYNVPGKCELLLNNVVKDANGNKFNLKITLENIKLYDLAEHPTYSTFDNYIFNVSAAGNIWLNNYFYDDEGALIAVNSSNTSKSMDVRISVVDNSGVKQNGTILFSATDLDVPSYRDTASQYIDPDGKGYLNYSEGLNFQSGFDLSTLSVSNPTATYMPNANRITGFRSDNNSEFTEFVISANASESVFTWTIGNRGGTQILGYYQPQIVELEKVDNHNNKVEGVELSLYNSDNELIDSWTTTNESKKLFLMPGMYILKETTNPNTNKYQTSEDITFFVDINNTLTINNQSVSKITMTNTIKQYSYVVNYFDQDGNVIRAQKVSDPLEYGTSVTSSDEVIDIPYWEYDRVDKDSITIQEGTNVINVYYKRPLYTLSINKVNNQGEALEGADFALYNEIEPSGTLDKDMMLDIYNDNSYYLQKNIIKIITTNHISIPTDAEDYWDVSVEQDGSVMAWTIVDNQTGYIELYIGQTGGVKVGYDNLGLFANLPMVEEIDLSYFHIDENSDISYMFAYNGNLKTIYVSDLWKHESSSINVFNDCPNIIGGNGTSYLGPEGSFAKVDKDAEPGYFTYKKVSTITEDQTGLEFNLQPGTYELKETKAPSGYKLDLKTYTVNVAEDGTITIDGKEVVQDEDDSKLYHVDMVNELMPNMPLTGGKGIIAFVITGLSLLVLGITGYFINKKRKA